MSLVNYIVKIIVSFFKDMVYHIEIDAAKADMEKAKEEYSEIKKDADSASDDFKLKLEQYRKGRRKQLREQVASGAKPRSASGTDRVRRAAKPVRGSAGATGGSGRSNHEGSAEAGQGHKGTGSKS